MVPSALFRRALKRCVWDGCGPGRMQALVDDVLQHKLNRVNIETTSPDEGQQASHSTRELVRGHMSLFADGLMAVGVWAADTEGGVMFSPAYQSVTDDADNIMLACCLRHEAQDLRPGHRERRLLCKVHTQGTVTHYLLVHCSRHSCS